MSPSLRKRCAVLLASLTLIACRVSVILPQETPSPPPFVTATLPPMNRSLSTPSRVPPTPAVTAPEPGCKDSAVLVRDVTIYDGENLPRGSKFTKTWQFQNTGTCTWAGYSIVFAAGDRMGAPDTAPLPLTQPQQRVDVSLELTAPLSDGAYTAYFELRNADGRPLAIGAEKVFWVKITVGTPTLPPANTPLVQPRGPASCKYTTSPSYQNEVAALINKARTQAGLPALSINAQLTAAAQNHSIDMACFSLLSHTGSDGSSIYERLVAAGYTPRRWLEVIYASGYPQDAFDWWMNHAEHRAAILDARVSEMGVGYAYVADSAYGGYYTVDFGSP